MRITTGQVARGKNFWNRKYEIEDIWESIQNHQHQLLVAPRRVGKTSIMHHIIDNPQDDYVTLYIDSEEDNFNNEFWARLFKALKKEEFINQFKTNSAVLIEKLKSINIKKVGLNSIEFDKSDDIDYQEAFISLVSKLPKEKKIVIMIDEFAQTIENIIKYQSKDDAIKLLKTHRALRQDQTNLENITFIYAGSIGLESVVGKIDAMKYINDLKPIKIEPLEFEEAVNFVQQLSEANGINIQPNQVKHMLEKIKWLIPFYIQLILDEIRRLSRKIDIKDGNTTIVDKAIENILEHRNFFDSYRSKIKEAFSDSGFLFAKEILNLISINDTISTNEISNIGDKYQLSDDERYEIIQALTYDGYINKNIVKDSANYQFNSPILKMWWYQNVAN